MIIQTLNPDQYRSTPVRQIMNSDIKKVNPEDDVYKAFKLLFQKDIGRLVVKQNDRLKGIITRSDILKGFRIKQLEEQAFKR